MVLAAASHVATGQGAPPASGLATFQQRVAAYAALHRKLEATLPALAKDASPDQIDRHQRALEALVQRSRSTARRGNVFSTQGEATIRALLQRVFATMDRDRLRETIQEDNPGPVALAVNARYPDQVPLASMPLEVLRALPPLPEELQYRFVGDALILLDPHAHIVVDYLPQALPR
jgi:hypothetical protein